MPFLPLPPLDRIGNSVHDPLSMYKISDEDIAGDPLYYGFLDVNGAWYILKSSPSASSYRYARGDTGYVAAWADRVSLGYDYFDIIF